MSYNPSPIAMLARRPRLLAAVALLVLGCDSKPTPGPTPSASATAAPLASGTRVIAAVTKVSFREGTVVASDDQQVTIAIGGEPGASADANAASSPATQPPATQTVKRDAVWPIAPLNPQEVIRETSKKGGDHGICKIEITGRQGAPAAWHPCEVTGGAGGKLRVRDAYGLRHTVAPDEVVLPDAPTRDQIASFLTREKRHREFDEAVEGAGRPYRPPEWDPAAGDNVVVHFVGPSYYSGEILEHKRNKGKVRVRYTGGTWDDRDLSPLEVAPVPTTTLPLSVDSYALVRPDKPTKRWEPVLIKSRDGDQVVATDRDDEEHRVPAADLLPLVPVTPAADAKGAR